MLSRNPASVVTQSRNRAYAASLSEPQLGLGVVIGIYAIVLLWLTRAQPLDGRAFLAVTDILGVLPAYFAAGLSFYAAVRGYGHVRWGWALLGTGCLAWALGDTVWAYLEVALEADPFPSLADVGYLAMLPLVAVGLTVLTAERRKISDARPALDGLALILCVVAFVWLIALQPIYDDSSAAVVEKSVSSAYPVGDLVVVYTLVVALQRRLDRGDGLVLGTLLCGMLLLVSADITFAYLNLNDAYSATSLVNVGWPFGFLLIGYAAALETNLPLSSEPAEQSTLHPAEWLMPAALLVALTALAVAAARENNAAVSSPMFAMVGVAAVALIARVAINLGLAREISERREQITGWLVQWTHERSS